MSYPAVIRQHGRGQMSADPRIYGQKRGPDDSSTRRCRRLFRAMTDNKVVEAWVAHSSTLQHRAPCRRSKNGTTPQHRFDFDPTTKSRTCWANRAKAFSPEIP